MSDAARKVLVQTAPSEEDLARAQWYALFADLFRNPPGAERLRGFAAAASDEADPSPLGQAWQRFAAACAAATESSVREEFESAFFGVGKAEVMLNSSFYLTGFLNERPLAELRQHLAGLGIARRGDVAETEDHVSSLCETMALLITSDDLVLGQLDTQREFFSRFIAPWYEQLADALEHSGATDFYKHAGRLMAEFLRIERQAFDFDS